MDTTATIEQIAERLLPIFREWRGTGVALSRDWLRQQVGCSDRVLRRAVTYLREEGELIIADPNGGYRLARSANEVIEYTSSLKSRIEALRTVVTAMESTATREFGASQMALL